MSDEIGLPSPEDERILNRIQSSFTRADIERSKERLREMQRGKPFELMREVLRMEREDDAPPPPGPGVRVTVSLEPEAAAMLTTLCQRLYPDKRIGLARGLVLEMAVRALYRRIMGDAGKA